jgi:hypothetical protein
MSYMLRRPPAREVHTEPQQGPTFAKQTFGAVDQAKSFGASSTTQFPWETTWLDTLQINPAHEQPRLDFTSARQPFIRWGVRHYSRTFMSASPRFFGRWAYIGQIQRAYTERSRITGVTPNRGLSYALPRFTSGPRTIQLGS